MTRDDGCISCLFYDRDRSGVGPCRANPPVVLHHRDDAVWPLVSDDDWCGGWRPLLREAG